MSSELTSKNVFLNGDRGAFLSKGAIDRFKADARSNSLKSSSAYFKDGWHYTISETTDKTIVANISVSIFQPTSLQQKEKFHEKLNAMKKDRQNKTQIALRLKKTVPQEIIDAYIDAKKSISINFMDPYDVITYPKKYQNDIQAIVQSTLHLSNPYTTYYRLLDKYLTSSSLPSTSSTSS
jgi:hypothetical protein